MKVSVVVPAFNAEQYLKECLLSVLHQTLGPYELLVVNDGSTDKTGQIAEKYTQNVISQENGGIGSARACGSKFAKGDYVAYLSADDAYNPYFLELMTRQHKNPDTIMFSNYWRCDEKLQPQKAFIAPQQNMRTRIIEYALTQNMFVNFSTVIIPKQVFKTVQFDEGLRYGEDLVFLLETVKAGFTWQNVSLPLVYYRVHPEAGTFKGWNPSHRSKLWRRLQPLLKDLGVSEQRIGQALGQAHRITLRKQRKQRIPEPLKLAYRKLRKLTI